MKQGQPIFSIIIPTYCRPVQLAACLQSLVELDYSRDCFEVVVVDDGGDAPLDPVVRSFKDALDVTLLWQPNAGPAAARNTGAAYATGRFLAFTDDDCTSAPGWLRALHARFASAPDRLVGGRTLNALPANPYSTASQTIVDVAYAYYNADLARPRFFASNNLAAPADCLRAIGGFDASFTTSEDRELCDRWRHAGRGLTYAPEAVVYHAHALTLRSFCRQHFNYGRGALRFHRACAQRGSGGFWREFGFYRRLPSLLGAALLREEGKRALMLIALFAIWQGVNAAGFFREAAKRQGCSVTDALLRQRG